MKKMSEPIVFFGSGPVAAESLRLLAQDFAVEAVITKPRPPHHRGDVPVLTVAEGLGLPIKTAADRKELDTLFEDASFKSRAGVLIDFGIIVSKKVIDYFPLGIINSHFSVLPEWRGADPITFAILSGQKTTGVSLMFLVPAMDEGPLLDYGEQPIDDDATTPALTDRLISLSHTLLQHDLPTLLSGQSKGGSPQDSTGREASYSRKLTKQDSILDWSKPAEQLEREVRAFIGWPRSRTTFNELEVVIVKTHVIKASGKPGDRTVLDKVPVVFCGHDALAIDRLRPAGKQEMTGEAFLAGHRQLFQ